LHVNKDLESLKTENQNLKAEIAKRDEKIRRLRHVLKETSKDLESRNETITFLKEKLRRVSEMLVDGFQYMSILDVIAEEK
jgi:peptidoglycan hydrolase CwlO-like protein